MVSLFLEEDGGLLTAIKNGLPTPLVSGALGKTQIRFPDSSSEQTTNSTLFAVYQITRWIRESKLGGILSGRGPSGLQGEPGPVGPRGALRPARPQGIMGSPGLNGVTGPMGPSEGQEQEAAQRGSSKGIHFK